MSNKHADTDGYCELAIGPMFAGKSSWIVRLYKQYTFYTDKIMVINYVGDTRYHTEECLAYKNSFEYMTV